ncbi:hypothetical protein T12_4106 [Trichinella patagoniensis]|nr:hypothetical protein T12_4106 [Trichinella patagoniensis]
MATRTTSLVPVISEATQISGPILGNAIKPTLTNASINELDVDDNALRYIPCWQE